MKKEKNVDESLEKKLEKAEERLEKAEERLEKAEEKLEIAEEKLEKAEEELEQKIEEVAELEEIQEEIIKENSDSVVLQAEIEKEKEEVKELEKENRKLRFSNSFLKIVLFIVFTIVVFTGGWYLGTKLVDLEDFIYGDTANPLSDKKIEFSKEEANKDLNRIYGNVLSAKGFISKVLFNEDVPEKIDLVQEITYKLAVVPKVDETLYGDSMFEYVSYENYFLEYEKMYGNSSDLEELLLDSSYYPKLVDDNKIIYDFYIDTGVEVSFDAEKIDYTAVDKTYTITGKYKEFGGDFCLLKGTVVNGTFELKYVINENGNKNIISMVITKTDMEIKKDK